MPQSSIGALGPYWASTCISGQRPCRGATPSRNEQDNGIRAKRNEPWRVARCLEALPRRQIPLEFGGEAGIRTLDRAFGPYNGLANRRLQPLGHHTAEEQ